MTTDAPPPAKRSGAPTDRRRPRPVMPPNNGGQRMPKPDLKPPKDADRLALVERFGYTVVLTSESLDTELPVFHRYVVRPTPRDCPGTRPRKHRLEMPVVHAAAFAIPCTRCWPETPDERTTV